MIEIIGKILWVGCSPGLYFLLAKKLKDLKIVSELFSLQLFFSKDKKIAEEERKILLLYFLGVPPKNIPISPFCFLKFF